MYFLSAKHEFLLKIFLLLQDFEKSAMNC